MKLPKLPYSGRYHTSVQTAFGGLEHVSGGKDGSIYDMKNLSARAYPLLSPRPKRGTLRTLSQPYGLTALEIPCWVDGTGFYADGVSAGTVSAGEKRFAAMGKSILIFPDKLRYDTETGTLSSLEAKWSGLSLQFRGGQIYGEDAEAVSKKAKAVFSAGSRERNEDYAAKIFTMLRDTNSVGCERVFAFLPPSTVGISLAIYNRLLRAAGFTVVDLEEKQ